MTGSKFIARYLPHQVCDLFRFSNRCHVCLRDNADTAALLRSLCVVQEYRGQAVGTLLLSAIEGVAYSRGVRDLYLLTTSSAGFFEQHGFSRTLRAAAPPGICATAQFRSLCPATASCMHKALLSEAGLKSSEGTGSK